MKNKVNVFLDDIRTPEISHNKNKGLGDTYSKIESWIIIRDYFSFVDYIQINFDNIALISFDHDLACYKNDVEYTGKTALNFLISYCLDNNKEFPNWYVHTDNNSGRDNMIGCILNYISRIENKNISNFRYFHRGIINNKIV